MRQLLRQPHRDQAWLIEADWRTAFQFALVILIGSSLYGFTLGIWRSSTQAFFTALKFPLVVFLTSAANAALNGMVAQLLGAGLSFRQTALAILCSFATAAVVLTAFSPITLFVWYNAPPLASRGAILGHSVMLVTHVFVIALAGVLANRELLSVLTTMWGTAATARRVVFSWLAGNLFLGAQIAWNLRPFIGSPFLPVQFVRDDPLRGNFYEAVGRAARHLIF